MRTITLGSRRTTTLTSTALAAGLAWLSGAGGGTAHAACPCPETVSGVVPRLGETGVAINTIVTLYADRLNRATDRDGTVFDTDSKTRLELRDQAAAKIDGTTVHVQVAGVTTMFKFDLGDMGKLPPNQKITAYAIDMMDKKHPITEFTTGAGEDTEPPGFPGISAFAATQDSWPTPNACIQASPINRATGAAPAASDNMTPVENLRYEFYFYKQGQSPPTNPTVVKLGAGADVEAVQSTAKCGLATFDALIPGTNYCGRVHVVDAAGKRSGLMMELCQKLLLRKVDENGGELSSGEGGGGCGCRVGSPDSLASGAASRGILVALGLLGLARRRRSRGR